MREEEPNSSNIQGDPDGLFDGSVRPVLAAEKKQLSREKWWLCEKARAGATMLLGCMHQEWMAQVDGDFRLSSVPHAEERFIAKHA